MTSRHTVTSLFPSEEPGAADVYVSVAEAMNPARRPQMEDVHIIHPAGQWPVSGTTLNDKAYLAVYDGHGGRDMVDFLEHALSHHLAQELLIDESVPLSTRLERAFLVTDIHALRSGITSSGATVACCVIQCLWTQLDLQSSHPDACQRQGPQQIRITAANAGDSRIVLGRKVDGTTRSLRLTHDHTARDPREAQRIEQAGGFVFKNRVMGILAITRSLGDHQLKPFVIAHPHVQETTVTLEDDAFLIVACDGFWDVVTDQQAVDLVRCYQANAPPNVTAAQFLVDVALRNGTTDNVTVMVGFFGV